MPKSSNQFWECNFLQSFSSVVGSSWMLIRFNYLFFSLLSGLPHSLWLLSLSFTSLTSSSLSGNSWSTSHMVIYVKKVSSGHFTYLLGVSVQPYWTLPANIRKVEALSEHSSSGSRIQKLQKAFKESFKFPKIISLQLLHVY